MPNTYQSIVVKAPIKDVWEKIKNFHDFSWAPNVITNCEAVGDKSGVELGAQRILNEAFHETLIELNDGDYRMRYSIDNGPSPVSPDDVSNYVGNLHLIPITDDNTTLVEWSSTWDSQSQDAIAFCHGIYVALLKDLVASFQ